MQQQLKSPNSIAAAIIEQFKNDTNNNVVEKPAQEQQSKKSKKAETVLKSTTLTDSMILIDNEAGKSSTRTDSNPSSSESLQDLDVGDGWATITSKKKRTVRREA